MTPATAAPARYTVAAGPRPLGARLRRALPWAAAAAVLLGTTLLIAAMSAPENRRPLSIHNAGPDGARAVARILEDRGVEVREVNRLAQAGIRDPEGTTVAITFPARLSPQQWESLDDYPGDVILLGTGDLDAGHRGIDVVSREQTGVQVRAAACDDADARAAREVATQGVMLSSETGVVCFADADGFGPYALFDDGGRRTVILADPSYASNGTLAEHGNAALLLRALGGHERLVWYSAEGVDTTTLTWRGKPPGGEPGPAEPTDLLPPGVYPGLLAALFAVLFAGFWRGRGMGGPVREPLPVVVPAAESTRGRARLYLRARATGRAGAALRAAAALRMGERLGMPAATAGPVLAARVARAADRPVEQVTALLYGPPPTTEAGMMELVRGLEALEKEVGGR